MQTEVSDGVELIYLVWVWVWVKGQNVVWVSDEHIAESPKLGGVIVTP